MKGIPLLNLVRGNADGELKAIAGSENTWQEVLDGSFKSAPIPWRVKGVHSWR